MIVVGLTGSIGMGKSTAAAMLRRMRVPLFDADPVVHRLLAPGGAAVAAVDGGVSRRAHGRRAASTAASRPAGVWRSCGAGRLERILHPMVADREKRFLARARARREPMAVLDVPLLFESRGAARCDYVVVVSAPALVQRQRVLRPAGDDRGALCRDPASSRCRIAEKRRRADFVVPTGLGPQA